MRIVLTGFRKLLRLLFAPFTMLIAEIWNCLKEISKLGPHIVYDIKVWRRFHRIRAAYYDRVDPGWRERRAAAVEAHGEEMLAQQRARNAIPIATSPTPGPAITMSDNGASSAIGGSAIPSSPTINPPTGLPMAGGGIDAGGHPYGSG